MKTSFLLICMAISSLSLFAQKEKAAASGQNVFKVNLSGLIVRNFSAQYERQIGKKMTVALNAHIMPFGKIPFESTIKDKIDISEIEIDKMKVGAFGIVPELRFYLGAAALKGFYIGPFVAYKNYKMNVPITYTTITTKTGIFDGNVSTITGGIQFGSQFRLSSCLTLDWWILGPNFGGGSGDLVFTGSLTPTEQQSLRDQIENIKDDIDIDIIRSYEVNANGASIQAKGPAGGIRAFGINLGYRF